MIAMQWEMRARGGHCEEEIVSNSRAELAAILETLKQNSMDDLEIESDSLSSLRAICNHLDKFEDLNWSGVKTQTF